MTNNIVGEFTKKLKKQLSNNEFTRIFSEGLKIRNTTLIENDSYYKIIDVNYTCNINYCFEENIITRSIKDIVQQTYNECFNKTNMIWNPNIVCKSENDIIYIRITFYQTVTTLK